MNVYLLVRPLLLAACTLVSRCQVCLHPTNSCTSLPEPVADMFIPATLSSSCCHVGCVLQLTGAQLQPLFCLCRRLVSPVHCERGFAWNIYFILCYVEKIRRRSNRGTTFADLGICSRWTWHKHWLMYTINVSPVCAPDKELRTRECCVAPS